MAGMGIIGGASGLALALLSFIYWLVGFKPSGINPAWGMIAGIVIVLLSLYIIAKER